MATIVIDPGHGGENAPGAVSGDGTRESDINLEVAKVVRDKLRGLGHECILTRQHDAGFDNRCRRALAVAYSADHFVSIHANSARTEGSGYEIYYRKGEPNTEVSCKFAHRLGAIYGRITGLTARSPSDGVKTSNYAVLGGHLPSTRAVLLEMAFMNNDKERKRMKTGKFRREVADSIAEAIGKPSRKGQKRG